MLKAVETRYKGYRMRSRSEARWGVFFDALSIEWNYEPEGYDLGQHGWYLPDFWLPQHRYLFEVKPSNYKIEDDLPKYQALSNALDGYLIIACGIPESNTAEVGNLNWIYPNAPSDDFIYGLVWGQTFYNDYRIGSHLVARSVEEWDIDPRLINNFDLCDMVEFAQMAARSARFEHGEKP